MRRRRRPRIPDHGANGHGQDDDDPAAARLVPASGIHLRRSHARRPGRHRRLVSEASDHQPAHAARRAHAEPDTQPAHRPRRDPGEAAFARGTLDRDVAREQGLAGGHHERDRAGTDPAPEVRHHEARARRAVVHRGPARGAGRDRAGRRQRDANAGGRRGDRDPHGQLRRRLRVPAVSLDRRVPLHALRRRSARVRAGHGLQRARERSGHLAALDQHGLVEARARGDGDRARRASCPCHHCRGSSQLGGERRAGCLTDGGA